MKICFKCGETKPLEEFYKHSKMADGRVNKCKICNKADAKKDYYIKSKDPDFIESERVRGREKYARLGYKDSQKKWDENKPWKKTQIYKNLHRKFKTPKGYELHHWNYNKDFLEDIIILKIKEHRQSHTHLFLDMDLLIFKTTEGNLLTTKEKHIEYLISKGIKL